MELDDTRVGLHRSDGPSAEPRVPDMARAVAAGALVAAAMVHFAYARPHFDHAASHGTFFVVAGWTQVVLAAGLALNLRPQRTWLTATAAANSAFIVLWVVSRTTGIPGEEAEPVALPDALATGLEAVAVVVSLALLGNLLVDRPVRRRPALGFGAAAAVATMALVSVSIAPSLAGGHSHGDDDHAHGDEEMAGHAHGDTDGESAGADHGHDEDEDDHGDDGHDDDGGDDHDDDGHDDGHDDGDDDDGHGHRTTTTHDDGHGHGTTTTSHDGGHGHGTTTTTHGHGTTTTTHGHPPGDDWPTIRLEALTGHLSDAGIAEFRQKAADHLAGEIRRRSRTLGELPEAEREARIAAFVNWSVDHALEAENGHSHGPEPWKPITDPAQQVQLQNQLAAASTIIPLYPTAADAEAAGYHQVTPYVPGIAAHYLNTRLTDRTFDPAQPEMLLYNGNDPTSKLVGVSYAMFGDEPGPDDGFVGDNDEWHGHPSLCIIGAFVIGPDHTPQDVCESVGAAKPNVGLWMSHLWQVPGWQSEWGLFSGENPAVNMATSDLMN